MIQNIVEIDTRNALSGIDETGGFLDADDMGKVLRPTLWEIAAK